MGQSLHNFEHVNVSWCWPSQTGSKLYRFRKFRS